MLQDEMCPPGTLQYTAIQVRIIRNIRTETIPLVVMARRRGNLFGLHINIGRDNM